VSDLFHRLIISSIYAFPRGRVCFGLEIDFFAIYIFFQNSFCHIVFFGNGDGVFLGVFLPYMFLF
jgi:hypothetical protein